MSTAKAKKAKETKAPKTPTEQPWQQYREDNLEHPDTVVAKHVKEDSDAYEIFLTRPFDDWVFNLWSTWLSIVLRSSVTELQVQAYRVALRERKFTNKDVIYCGGFFEENSIYFPMMADWLSCPVLPRVEDRIQEQIREGVRTGLGARPPRSGRR